MLALVVNNDKKIPIRDRSGRFAKGFDPRDSIVDGFSAKWKRCPLLSRSGIRRNCVGDRCALWVVVHDPEDDRIVKSGCSFVLGSEAEIALSELLERK